jgi:MinD superfamily P-loop ATPase
MIVAVASGKGGTGKTTISASLAHIWPGPVVAVDLDVEEPNLHLFLKPQISNRQTAYMLVPRADESKCTYCRACSDLCQFKAVSVLGEVLLICPEMCHGCGGCFAVCPEGVLSPDQRKLGEISRGKAGRIDFLMGRLRVGEAMSPPLMREVKKQLNEIITESRADVIIDAPPGVSCPAVNAVMDSDIIVLVTEPTPFGLYDLQLAVKAFEPFGIPMGVVINRAGIGDDAVYDFCHGQKLPILANIPYERKIAEAYANGQLVAETSETYRSLFLDLTKSISRLSSKKTEAAHA